MKIILVICFLTIAQFAISQTGIGVGLYPTGTETGLGIRTSKDDRLIADARITRANIFSEKTKTSSFVTELSLVYRAVKLEKVRFHIGIGYKADWNLNESHKHGFIVPIGVEAFPFPFQNAGLFFEAAPFYVSDFISKDNSGIRTTAGFVFYFPTKTKKYNTDNSSAPTPKS